VIPGDLKQAARRLLAAPLFTLFAVLSLAIGIGLTTAVYSVIDAIFLTELGIRDPARVVYVVNPGDGRYLTGSISRLDFQDLRAAQRSFSSVSAAAMFRPAVSATSTALRVGGEAVDGEYFATLGVPMSLGRAIRPADETAGARVAVVSHRFWRARLGADPNAVGRSIRIGGHPFEVIGVAALPFAGAGVSLTGTSVWIPLGVEDVLTPPGQPDDRNRRRLITFGRLTPSATVEAASAELKGIAANLDRAFPSPGIPRTGGAGERPWIGRSIETITEEDNVLRRFGLTLVALVALVLVVACTNLANLVLARGTARQQEFTVRWALGASRWRLIREQCAESLLLAIGGAVGAFLVFQGLSVLMESEISIGLPFGNSWTMSIRPTLDGGAVWIAGALLLLSMVVFGLEPALQLTRAHDIRGELAAGGGGAGNPRTRRQGLLLRWQVAVSAGFFVIATLFVKFSITEARHDPGIELERLAVAIVNLPRDEWNEDMARRLSDRLIEEAKQEGSLDSISVSTGMPFGTGATGAALSLPQQAALSLPGQATARGATYSNAVGIGATPSFFRTTGIRILRGRGFDDRDHAAAPPVLVISEFTARQYFGTIDAVGRQLVVQSRGMARPAAAVIGVAANTDVRMMLSDPRAMVYWPLAQHSDPFLAVAARSASGAAAAVPALRDVLRRADPDLPVDLLGTGRMVMAGPFAFLRALGMTALGLGVITLLLAMAGLFGIQSHIVARRTREIGVRMSFGATAGQIQRMILRDGYRPVIDGLILGLAGGLAGRVIARAYVDIDVNVVDPWMLVIVPIPLVLAAFCACFLPARRAAAVDPNVALRHL
jgi:predicted permease